MSTRAGRGERLGFSAINERQRRVLGTCLRHEARTVADTGALIQFARRWLYDHRLVILATRSLKELIASILAQVERSQYLEVLNIVPEAVCQAWQKQLYTLHPHYQVQLIDWLKIPPAKRSPKHLIEVFDKIAQRKALGVHCRYRLSASATMRPACTGAFRNDSVRSRPHGAPWSLSASCG